MEPEAEKKLRNGMTLVIPSLPDGEYRVYGGDRTFLALCRTMNYTRAARQLCITPKYLTTLIKRISGKSASEWIDSFVILEAKTLLKYSDMSVQEIAYALNFPNQSFFGSYFKRNTGMSPSHYKAQP